MHKRMGVFSSAPAARASAGFTLVEMLFVIALIVLVASVVLSQLGDVQTSSQHGVISVTQGQLLENLTQYYALNNAWPDQLDSLLHFDNPGWSPYPSLLLDLFAVGGKQRLTIADPPLTALQVQSLTNAGLLAVMDHRLATELNPPANPNDSGVNARILAAGDKIAWLNDTTTEGQRIIASFSPPAGTRLAVFGLGVANGANRPVNPSHRPSLATTPTAPSLDGDLTRYRRFLAVFAVFNGGARAKLLGILDASGETAGENLRKSTGESPS